MEIKRHIVVQSISKGFSKNLEKKVVEGFSCLHNNQH